MLNVLTSRFYYKSKEIICADSNYKIRYTLTSCVKQPWRYISFMLYQSQYFYFIVDFFKNVKWLTLVKRVHPRGFAHICLHIGFSTRNVMYCFSKAYEFVHINQNVQVPIRLDIRANQIDYELQLRMQLADWNIILGNMTLFWHTCVLCTVNQLYMFHLSYCGNVSIPSSPLTAHIYRQVSNIRRTKSQQLKDSRTVLRLSLPIPLKPDVKSRMKM